MNNEQRFEKTKVVVEKCFYGENYYCPSCKKYLGGDHNDLADINYCQKCGQALSFENIKDSF